MRELMREGIATTHRSTDNALKYLLKIMKDEGPFDGIIGYSEGATVAATLLLHEQRRFKKKGIKPMFKYAIFFAGWPPVDPDRHNIILSDESDEMIDIPTCHISKFLPAEPFAGSCLLTLESQLAPSTPMFMARWRSTTCVTPIPPTCSTMPRATPCRAIRRLSRSLLMSSGMRSKPMVLIAEIWRIPCWIVYDFGFVFQVCSWLLYYHILNLPPHLFQNIAFASANMKQIVCDLPSKLDIST
jgi:hypothetical protein